jgi:hypothetical protein
LNASLPSIDDALYETRLRLKTEMRNALLCRTPKQKRALVKEWEAKYNPSTVVEMLSVARDKKAAGDIANWDLSRFEEQRKRK